MIHSLRHTILRKIACRREPNAKAPKFKNNEYYSPVAFKKLLVRNFTRFSVMCYQGISFDSLFGHVVREVHCLLLHVLVLESKTVTRTYHGFS